MLPCGLRGENKCGINPQLNSRWLPPDYGRIAPLQEDIKFKRKNMDRMLDFKALPDIEGESPDVSKNVTNIDKEDFDFINEKVLHTIEKGETVTYPKYKVLFVAHHLARKIVKRDVLSLR